MGRPPPPPPPPPTAPERSSDLQDQLDAIQKLQKLAEGGEDAINKLTASLRSFAEEARESTTSTETLQAAINRVKDARDTLISQKQAATDEAQRAALQAEISANRELAAGLEKLEQASKDYNIVLKDMSEQSLQEFINSLNKAKDMTDEFAETFGGFLEMIPVVGNSLSKATKVKQNFTKAATGLSKALKGVGLDRMSDRVGNLAKDFAQMSTKVALQIVGLIALGAYIVKTGYQIDRKSTL